MWQALFPITDVCRQHGIQTDCSVSGAPALTRFALPSFFNPFSQKEKRLPDVPVKVLPPSNMSKILLLVARTLKKKMHPVVHGNHYGPPFAFRGKTNLRSARLYKKI